MNEYLKFDISFIIHLVSVEPSLLERRLYEAFDVFDNARSGEADVRDLGTIIRALGNNMLEKLWI